MQQAGPVRIYGKRGCPAAYAIRDYLQRSDIPFEWIELRDDEYARKELGVENVDDLDLHLRRRYAHGTANRSPNHREARLVPQSVSV
jgi:glutaredoxin